MDYESKIFNLFVLNFKFTFLKNLIKEFKSEVQKLDYIYSLFKRGEIIKTYQYSHFTTSHEPFMQYFKI